MYVIEFLEPCAKLQTVCLGSNWQRFWNNQWFCRAVII